MCKDPSSVVERIALENAVPVSGPSCASADAPTTPVCRVVCIDDSADRHSAVWLERLP